MVLGELSLRRDVPIRTIAASRQITLVVPGLGEAFDARIELRLGQAG
jgi:hypothetical protein